MSAGEPVRLDLAALRAELAASPGAGRLQPLGLGRVIEGDGALDELARAVADFPRSGAGVVVLAAATPMRVAGWDLRAEATEVLGRGFAVDWATLGPADGQVHADERTVTAARQATAGAGCVVTIGSGTITDIGKAATRNGTPLVAVQTATSVNGYADSFSVLLHRGVKRTTPARWPDTLLIDAAILRAAPPELNLAGVGDLMAMFTATADWYLASAMTDDSGHDAAAAGPPYNAAVAGVVRAHGGRLLTLAADLAAGAGPEAGPGGAATGQRLTADLAELARILTLSGITMGVAGLNRPGIRDGARGQPPARDGCQCPGTARQLSRHPGRRRERRRGGHLGARAPAHRRGRARPARIPDPDQARDRIREAFKGTDSTGLMAAECFAGYARKLRPLVGGSDPLARLRNCWDSHEAVLTETLIEPGELADGLRSAGLPASFGELPEPVSDEDARWAVASCPLQRQRFGVADLAMLLGAWEEDDIDEVLADAAVLTGRP